MLKKIFSMKVAVFIIFLFGVIIGIATFIENDYGTQTAQAIIYNSFWFELFLLFFISILIVNMIKYKVYKLKKWNIFIFHISFIVIAIGALTTRYIGYEGIMSIREGEKSNIMVSSEKMLNINISNNEKSKNYEKRLILSSMTKNNFSKTLEINKQKIKFEIIDYLPAVIKRIIPLEKGKTFLEFMISEGNNSSQIITLSKGKFFESKSFIISFEKDINKTDKELLYIFEKEGKLLVKTNFSLNTFSMKTKKNDTLAKGINLLERKKLYQFAKNNLVVKNIYKNSIEKYISNSLKSVSHLPELISIKVSTKDKNKVIKILANDGKKGNKYTLVLDDINISLSIGSKIIKLPFYLKLINFELKRYPGSNSPSSFSSDIELTDIEKHIKNQAYKIYMNNVLDHRNYRFFQSSYDMDEKGTILSVNHDPGTIPTYLGYFLLLVGIIYNLFSKKSRFQKLLRESRTI